MPVVRWSCLLVAFSSNVLFGQNIETVRNIAYKPEASNEYERERCTFDLVVPSEKIAKRGENCKTWVAPLYTTSQRKLAGCGSDAYKKLRLFLTANGSDGGHPFGRAG